MSESDSDEQPGCRHSDLCDECGDWPCQDDEWTWCDCHERADVCTSCQFLGNFHGSHGEWEWKCERCFKKKCFKCPVCQQQRNTWHRESGCCWFCFRLKDVLLVLPCKGCHKKKQWSIPCQCCGKPHQCCRRCLGLAGPSNPAYYICKTCSNPDHGKRRCDYCSEVDGYRTNEAFQPACTRCGCVPSFYVIEEHKYVCIDCKRSTK